MIPQPEPGPVWLIQTAPLGDLVLTLPLIESLRQRTAPRPLVLVVRDGHEALARTIPGVAAACDRLTAWRTIRDAPASLLVSAHRSFRSGRLAQRSGAALRIGFDGCWGRWGWSVRVPRRMDLTASRRYLELVRPLGLDPDAMSAVPTLPIDPAEAAQAAAWRHSEGIGDGENWLALAPGAAWGTKRWPADRFRAWVSSQSRANRKVVAFGTPAESDLCLEVTQGIPGALSAAGETSLPQLAARLGQASLFLGNDSGAGHLASAVGTPVVTLFGPTVPQMGFAPQGERDRIVEVEGLDCRPCHRHGPKVCPRSHFRCMLELDPERVCEVTDALLR